MLPGVAHIISAPDPNPSTQTQAMRQLPVSLASGILSCLSKYFPRGNFSLAQKHLSGLRSRSSHALQSHDEGQHCQNNTVCSFCRIQLKSELIIAYISVHRCRVLFKFFRGCTLGWKNFQRSPIFVFYNIITFFTKFLKCFEEVHEMPPTIIFLQSTNYRSRSRLVLTLNIQTIVDYRKINNN